jgi:hypothetical protein
MHNFFLKTYLHGFKVIREHCNRLLILTPNLAIVCAQIQIHLLHKLIHKTFPNHIFIWEKGQLSTILYIKAKTLCWLLSNLGTVHTLVNSARV